MTDGWHEWVYYLAVALASVRFSPFWSTCSSSFGEPLLRHVAMSLVAREQSTRPENYRMRERIANGPRTAVASLTVDRLRSVLIFR